MFKMNSHERTINNDIKMLNEENTALLKQIKKLQEENYNLKNHIMYKDERIVELRFKVEALETLLENWSKKYEIDE